MTAESGPELADQLYREWKKSTEKIPDTLLAQLPEEWRAAETLNPELAAYLYESDFMGPVLKHPLVFGVPYMVWENPRYNYGLHWKRECLEKYAANRNLDGFIYAHERPYRMHALQRILRELKPTEREVWQCANTAWTDSENIFEHEDDWYDLFNEYWDCGRQHFMTDDDRAEWASYPNSQPITVYRGFSVDGRHEGMSWTVDKTRAQFFAQRFANIHSQARLAIGRVMKDDCVGYLNGRNESEVVVFPEYVEIARIATLENCESEIT